MISKVLCSKSFSHIGTPSANSISLSFVVKVLTLGVISIFGRFMYQCVICRASFIHPSLIQEHVARAHMHLFEHQQPSYQPVVVPGAGGAAVEAAANKLAATAVAAAAAGATVTSSAASETVPQAAVIEQQDIPSTSRFPPDKEPLVFYSTGL